MGKREADKLCLLTGDERDTADGLTEFINIKNVDQRMARIDTDDQSRVFIGGGKDDAKRIVGEEFAEITGGTWIDNSELDNLLAAILTSGGNQAPGLEGVELVSIGADTFTLAIDSTAGTTDFIEFSGSAAQSAIELVLDPNNRANADQKTSQVAVFEIKGSNKLFIGDFDQVSDEADDIVQGSKMEISEAKALFSAATEGKASNGTAGVDGIEIVGLTDEGFALRVSGQSATVDTIIIEGQGAIDAIHAAEGQPGADLNDANSGFGILDASDENSVFVGTGKSGMAANVSQEWADIVGGDSLQKDEVLEIFEALIGGNGRSGTDGLDGVELIGLNDTSFSIAIESAGGNTDYVLFTDVDTLDGADQFGFGDGAGADLFS